MKRTAWAEKIFRDTLKQCRPASLLKKQLSIRDKHIIIQGDQWELPSRPSVYIVGLGKAAVPMCESLQAMTGVDKRNVFCITPQQKPPTYAITGAHPAPDDKSVQAAEKLINFVEQIPPGSLILFALSGGASALACKPAEKVSLDDLNTINHRLLASGAAIEEINAVRKHCSALKGGQLLMHINPECTLLDLVISDVPGDDLEVIGSGPTTPDSSTFQDAYDTLLRYALWNGAPASIKKHIERGLDGEIPETVKVGGDPLMQHHSYIVGSAQIFAREMAKRIEKTGVKVWVADHPYNQPVAEVAELIFQKISKASVKRGEAKAFVFYGESTVKVRGEGKGGRNQELALRGALKIAGLQGVSWLSAGTDGIDGPTDAAGAAVDDGTMDRARKKGLKAEPFLANNDSYHFHRQMSTLVKTGPTGNNMMDVTLIIVD